MSNKPPWKRLVLTLENYHKVRDGEKTQTRRVIKEQPEWHPEGTCDCHEPRGAHWCYKGWTDPAMPPPLAMCEGARYQPGEIIGLTCPHWRCAAHGVTPLCIWDGVTRTVRYEDGKRPIRDVAGVENPPWKHMAARLMPAWACMDFARITDVRAGRLQDITLDAIEAEGWVHPERPVSLIDRLGMGREWFVDLWDSIYAERGDGFDTNKWVWAYTFENVETP